MDLSTTYLGLKLKNPLVPSSSPLTRDLGLMKRLEDAGASAVVLYSLFEEEINRESHMLDRYLTENTNSYAEALSYFTEAPSYHAVGADMYLNHLRKAKESLDIPVIASLNGVSKGGWLRYAKEMEQAGADALELNIYYLPTSLEISAAEVEQIYVDVLTEVKAAVNIPIAMKLSPFFSATGHMAKVLTDAGADGLVLFNRFYQPDLDLENLAVVPNLHLSHPDEMRLPLRWIAILYGRVAADLALTGGVHTGHDALKAVAGGAAVAMMASVLLQKGIHHLTDCLREMENWLIDYEYDSLEQLRGSLSQLNCAEPAAFERANYMRVLNSYRLDWLQKV